MPRHKKDVQKPEETLESKIERVMERVLEGFAFIPPEMLRIGGKRDIYVFSLV